MASCGSAVGIMELAESYCHLNYYCCLALRPWSKQDLYKTSKKNKKQRKSKLARKRGKEGEKDKCNKKEKREFRAPLVAATQFTETNRARFPIEFWLVGWPISDRPFSLSFICSRPTTRVHPCIRVALIFILRRWIKEGSYLNAFLNLHFLLFCLSGDHMTNSPHFSHSYMSIRACLFLSFLGRKG